MLIFQELLKPSASSSDPLPFKLLPKLVKTANGASTTCSASLASDTAAAASVSSRNVEEIKTLFCILTYDSFQLILFAVVLFIFKSYI